MSMPLIVNAVFNVAPNSPASMAACDLAYFRGRNPFEFVSTPFGSMEYWRTLIVESVLTSVMAEVVRKDNRL